MAPVSALGLEFALPNMNRFRIAVTVVAALIGSRAFAADLAAPLPPAPAPNLQFKAPPPPPAAPSSSWSGPYVGAGLSARYDAVDGDITSATIGTPPTPIPLPKQSAPLPAWEWWGNEPGAMQYIDNVAMSIGLYAGWNWQVWQSYVVGVEADFAYANETADFHGSPYPANLMFGTPSLAFGATPADDFKVTTRWDGSVRVRGGWLATPALLLYFTAGLAWADISSVSRCATHETANVSNCAFDNFFGGTLGPYLIAHSALQLGWTVGFGIETLLWQHWVLRTQYRFADFGYPSAGPFSAFTATDVRTCTGCSAANTPMVVSYQLPLMEHSFEFGLAYKLW